MLFTSFNTKLFISSIRLSLSATDNSALLNALSTDSLVLAAMASYFLTLCPCSSRRATISLGMLADGLTNLINLSPSFLALGSFSPNLRMAPPNPEVAFGKFSAACAA